MVELAPRERPGRVQKRLGFCPECGSELSPTLVELRILGGCRRCGYVAYCTPTVVAVAVLRDREQPREIWLIRRAIEPFAGSWALPGGYVDAPEHPEAAARRECAEEVGCDVRIDRLLTVQHAAFGDSGVVVIAYAATIMGVPRPGSEVLEVRRFAVDERPRLIFETHEAAVGEWLALS